MAVPSTHKRYHSEELTRNRKLSLEERGAYFTITDLTYASQDGYLVDDRYLSYGLGCDPRIWKRIRSRLIFMGLLHIDSGKIWPVSFNPSNYTGWTGAMRPAASEWNAIRAAVFERDGHVCTYCGDAAGPFECDHVHPVSKGGGHDLDNLVTACRPCNRKKHARTVGEWRGEEMV